ncbi:hypothetical protein E1B28_007757 [Marasmius oreades]|uniref:Fungal-type protein kinase domain-containing protein n=1 Tax=Marasmius oreades TaxID=181124 RepID=A0A9P7UUC6_9AGAR|nr:uncharacterized protein E1B28_007757 [Marasmius oreades]KAG7094145.1 hypothetical protein E1B28_007757 [Marasmius oreades]
MSDTTSTPHKKNSSHRGVHRAGGGTADQTPPQSQAEMMEYCQDEIAHNTWQFEASSISHMLSPKSLKNNVPPEDIRCFEDAQKHCKFLVDAPFFEPALETAVKSLSPSEWPSSDAERDYYTPLANFLNDCIQKCNNALNAQKSDRGVPEFARRLYGKLKFAVYDRPMLDGIDGAAAVKPNLGSSRNLQEGVKLSWGAVEAKGVRQMDVPGEVKLLWSQLLAQAAVYARYLFSASPTRTWSLVLGFNQKEKNLRFLIFHRGGCTASTDLNLTTEQGRKEACRLILTMLLWTEDYHAGFCCFSTDKEYAIPGPERDPTLFLKARVEKNLHHTLAVCTRGTLVSILSKSAIDPTPLHHLHHLHLYLPIGR